MGVRRVEALVSVPSCSGGVVVFALWSRTCSYFMKGQRWGRRRLEVKWGDEDGRQDADGRRRRQQSRAQELWEGVGKREGCGKVRQGSGSG